MTVDKGSGGNGRRLILIVDDDPGIRDVVSMTLEDEGFDPITAADGQEALDALKELDGHPPEAIILDMNMPRVSGWEFARLYRETDLPRAPIIVVTAGHDVRKRCQEIGADGCIGKPFELDRLVATVVQHTHQHAA